VTQADSAVAHDQFHPWANQPAARRLEQHPALVRVVGFLDREVRPPDFRAPTGRSARDSALQVPWNYR
jgi:hypothetical protein